jgi:N-acyl-D-amino-acid deacylase
VVIRNGRIVDGTGSPWYAGDIAIRGRARSPPSDTWRAPRQAHHRRARHGGGAGIHRHAGPVGNQHSGESASAVEDLPGHHHRGHRRRLVVAPLNDAIIKLDRVGWEHYGIKPDWRTFAEYFARLRKQGMGINLASYVGATQVRRVVIGEDDRAPTAEELERMKALVRQAMRDGAVGSRRRCNMRPRPMPRPKS